MTLFYELWFPKTTQNITIVAPPSSDGLPDAELTSANYALLDRLGDRDTVYAIGKLLSRRYPRAVIHLCSAEDLTRLNFSQNFVIIGGPGGLVTAASSKPDPMSGNAACRHFSERFRSRFSYSDDCEELRVGSQALRATVDSLGHMTKDFGVFAAFVNPYLRSTRIIMLHGIHTLGVLGAARLFDGELDSAPNFALLEKADAPPWQTLKNGFECYFDVNILFGEVECPALDASNIFALREKPDQRELATGASATEEVPASILSSEELRTDVLARLRVAKQQALTANQRALDLLITDIAAIRNPELECIRAILEICRKNARIPPENIRAIRSVLDDHPDETS
jgi:hypothetical protein